MVFEERQLPGDGTLAAAFRCPCCERVVAMLTNPIETQLVASLGVKIGGRTVSERPLETIRTTLATAKDDALGETSQHEGRRGGVTWSPEALERLSHVPAFVRGMVKRVYAEYAGDHGMTEITPAVMDSARKELGLEGM